MTEPNSQRYLLAYRNAVLAEARPPSPEDIQRMLAQFNAWKSKYMQEIVDLGDGLRPAGKVVRAGTTTDGPFVEAKEVLGGYSIVQVAGLDRALEIARTCPVLSIPGASVEVREMAGY